MPILMLTSQVLQVTLSFTSPYQNSVCIFSPQKCRLPRPSYPHLYCCVTFSNNNLSAISCMTNQVTPQAESHCWPTTWSSGSQESTACPCPYFLHTHFNIIILSSLFLGYRLAWGFSCFPKPSPPTPAKCAHYPMFHCFLPQQFINIWQYDEIWLQQLTASLNK